MKASDAFLIVAGLAFVISMILSIDVSMHNIRVSSFRLGCMNAGATAEVVEQCKALAEEKVGHGYQR